MNRLSTVALVLLLGPHSVNAQAPAAAPVAPAAAHAGTPAFSDTAVVRDAMAYFDPLWDDRAALLWAPPVDDRPPVSAGRDHRVRESAWYALGLLQRDGPGDRARALRAIEAVLRQQIDEPGEPWDGTFYRAPEERHIPLFPELWRDYDANWRQFIACTWALMLLHFDEAIPPALQQRIEKSLTLAIRGEETHDRLKPTYTNIALMHAFMLGYAGERLKRPEWVQAGDAWVDRVYATFRQHDAFEEYNSPTYYGVDFYGLSLWRVHGATEKMRQRGAELEAALWRDTARFYHAGLQNLAGPYDRAYGMDMRSYVSLTGVWLRFVLPAAQAPLPTGEGPMNHVHDLIYAPAFALLGTKIPEEALTHFRAFQGERFVQSALPRGRTATAWLGEKLMLGGEFTANGRGAGGEHNQFHPATIHWRAPAGDLGWILLTEAPRVDARAAKNELTIEATGTSTLRIHVAGLQPAGITRGSWALPGLDVQVESDATGFTATPGDGWVDVTYREATRIILRTTLVPR